MDEPVKCTLVASFAARQAIIMAAVLLFMLYTWIQIRRGVEKRSLTTLVADASKQAGQQAFGGAMMVLLGVLLAHHKYDSLAWYAAECAPRPPLAAERDRMHLTRCARLRGGRSVRGDHDHVLDRQLPQVD